MKLEFENLQECLEFAEAICSRRDSDMKKVTTEEMEKNKKWLHQNRLSSLNLDIDILNNTISKYIEKTSELEKQILSLKKQYNNNETAPDKIISAKKKPVKKTIRGISRAYGINIDNIERLERDGRFKRKGRGVHYYKWTIQDLLKLKKMIPDSLKYPSCGVMAEEFNFSQPIINDLVYYIENGDFDKYFDEWEQMEADKVYKKFGNWKPIIENNPQKRREKGMS